MPVETAAGAEVAFVMAKGYRKMRSVEHPESLRFRQPCDQLAFQLIKQPEGFLENDNYICT